MKLRTQVGVMLIAVFGCLVAVSTVVQLRVIYPSFERLESSLAKTDADRCVQAINREVDVISKFAIDWSVWDDMYQFVQDDIIQQLRGQSHQLHIKADTSLAGAAAPPPPPTMAATRWPTVSNCPTDFNCPPN